MTTYYAGSRTLGLPDAHSLSSPVDRWYDLSRQLILVAGSQILDRVATRRSSCGKCQKELEIASDLSSDNETMIPALYFISDSGFRL